MAKFVVGEIVDSLNGENVHELPFKDDGKYEADCSGLKVVLKEIDENLYKRIEEEAKPLRLRVSCHNYLDRWGFDDYSDHQNWDETESLGYGAWPTRYLVRNNHFMGVLYYSSREGADIPIGALSISGRRYGTVSWSVEESEGKTDISKGESYYLERISEKEVIIEEGTTRIEDFAFSCSTSLEKVVIPSSVTHIGQRAFAYCPNLKKIQLPLSCSIGRDAFFSTRAELSYIVEDILLFLSLEKSDTRKRISLYEGSGEEITKIVIPEGVEEIPSFAFAGAHHIKEVIFPSSLKRIGKGAFAFCEGLEEVVLPISCKELGEKAFCDCGHLKMTMPLDASIGEEAFYRTHFKELTFLLDEELPLSFSWKDIDREKAITHLKNSKGEEITRLIVKEGVKEIPPKAFAYFEYLEEVILPSSLETIGERAFCSCESLRNISFGKNLAIIKEMAFAYCSSFTSVALPEAMEEIGESAFYHCANLREATLPKDIGALGGSLFAFCPLSELRIPEGVKEIKEGFFEHIRTPITIHLPKSVAYVGEASFEDVNIEALYAYYGTAFSHRPIFKFCKGLQQIRLIVSDSQSDSIHALPIDGAILVDEGLNPIEIEMKTDERMEAIPNRFYKNNGNIAKVRITPNIKVIEEGAFVNCASLKEVIFEGHLEKIGEYAFYGCPIEILSIPLGAEKIDAYAFKECNSLREIHIPKGVSSIHSCAFPEKNHIERLTLPASCKIGDGSSYTYFFDHAVATYILDASFDELATHRHYEVKEGHLVDLEGKEITELVFGEGIDEVPSFAFANFKNIEYARFDEGATEIGFCAFENATSLKEVSFPASLKAISSRAFSNCVNLEKVSFKRVETIMGKAFEGCSSIKAIAIDQESPLWIHERAFKDCKGLETFKANGAKSTGQLAFEGCESLLSFDGGEALESIDEYAFIHCSSLKKIFLPSKLEVLCLSAFVGCRELEAIEYRGSKKSWEKVKIAHSFYLPPTEEDIFSGNFGGKEYVHISDTTPKAITVVCCDGELTLEIRV